MKDRAILLTALLLLWCRGFFDIQAYRAGRILLHIFEGTQRAKQIEKGCVKGGWRSNVRDRFDGPSTQ